MDILLPVDAVLGLLATAVEREREAQMPGMVDPHAAQREDFAATSAVAAAAAVAAASSAVDSTVDGMGVAATQDLQGASALTPSLVLCIGRGVQQQHVPPVSWKVFVRARVLSSFPRRRIRVVKVRVPARAVVAFFHGRGAGRSAVATSPDRDGGNGGVRDDAVRASLR